MGFSRQGYWTGLPFPSPGDLPDPGIKPGSPVLQADCLPSEPPRSPFSSVAQSCLTVCNPMDCSMPGLPVHYQLPEFTQTHVHRISDAIQPSHLLSSASPPTFNLSQHEGLFQRVSSSHQVAKILEFHLQHHLSYEHPGLISLGWTGWISLQSKGHSRVFSNTTVHKHQFFSAQLSL